MKLSKCVFNLDNVQFGAVPVGENRCRFDEKVLEKALKAIIHKAEGDENAPMADPNDQTPKCCPVFVIATMGENSNDPVKLFRSYGKEKDKCPIWQAARATSAAPTYFPEVFVPLPRPGCWYIDGGLKRNNPSEVALEEAREYWKMSRRFLLVSIGTGVQKTADFIERAEPPDESENDSSSNSEGGSNKNPKRVKINTSGRFLAVTGKLVSNVGAGVKAVASNVPLANEAVKVFRLPGGLKTVQRFAEELVVLSTNCEDTHNKMLTLANSHDAHLQFPYYRFNIPSGMEKIGLEEWKKQTKIASLTWGYLRRYNIKREVEKCAESLLNPSAFESI
jgi:predicted acylesterase/phospholipase RssA